MLPVEGKALDVLQAPLRLRRGYHLPARRAHLIFPVGALGCLALYDQICGATPSAARQWYRATLCRASFGMSGYSASTQNDYPLPACRKQRPPSGTEPLGLRCRRTPRPSKTMSCIRGRNVNTAWSQRFLAGAGTHRTLRLIAGVPAKCEGRSPTCPAMKLRRPLPHYMARQDS